MSLISKGLAWARANRKYTFAVVVLGLVILALTHPGARGYRPYSAEVSDAVAHAVDAPAEPKKDAGWRAFHDQLAKEMQATKDLDLILYGDSIFESLLGTIVGTPGEQFANTPAVWEKHHGRLKSKIMAISGDTTINLLWRLQNGELPPDTRTKQAAVLIGSNDLVAYHSHQLTDVDETASAVSAGVIAVCEQLLDHSPHIKILLLAVMQRGNKQVEAPAAKALIPNKFSGAIDNINDRLEQYADGRKQITYVDCHEIFLADNSRVEGGRKINVDLMPDVLHPNAQGMELMLTKCLDPALAGKAVNLKPEH